MYSYAESILAGIKDIDSRIMPLVNIKVDDQACKVWIFDMYTVLLSEYSTSINNRIREGIFEHATVVSNAIRDKTYIVKVPTSFYKTARIHYSLTMTNVRVVPGKCCIVVGRRTTHGKEYLQKIESVHRIIADITNALRPLPLPIARAIGEYLK